MAIEMAGFAQALGRCEAFKSIDVSELENVLSDSQEPLEMLIVEPSADVALIRSGEPFTHLYFVQHGMIVPWQYPYSELLSPFLIGDHEFMMESERWVASYSAATPSTVVGIPVATLKQVVERIPQVHDEDVSRGFEAYVALLLDIPCDERESSTKGCRRSNLPTCTHRRRSWRQAGDIRAAGRHRPPHSNVAFSSLERNSRTGLRRHHSHWR